MATALVTGANRGIGRALAERLATRGPVIATTRAPHPPEAAGIRWETLEATDPESHDALARALDGTPITLLVCNAGVYLDKGESLVDGFAPDLWAETFAANVTGVFLTVQRLLPNLQAAEGAKVAIVASQMGSSERAGGGSYIYRASKAAAVNLGRNLAVDLEGLGIAVGLYHPGWVRTDMGGANAAVDVAQSAAGLVERFDALTLARTGGFEDWTGAPIPF